MKLKLIVLFSAFILSVQAQLHINESTCPTYLEAAPCLNPQVNITNEKVKNSVNQIVKCFLKITVLVVRRHLVRAVQHTSFL
jgi:hypothetical protein